jgi:predicted dehydrogenase
MFSTPTDEADMGFTPVPDLRQAWARPSHPRPIVIIGAGGIVNDAHLPAYRLAEFPVAGIFDIDRGRAKSLADRWNLKSFSSLEEAAAVGDAVFDLATPPAAHFDVLGALPKGSVALIQKPLGRDLDEATGILKLARERNLTAAVNFQLRFSPMMLALADALQRGLLGRLIDVEIHLNILTPWHLFPFLKGLPRVEIAVHSIHYFDFIRSLLGNPNGVHARTMGHPLSDMAQTRTSAILDFGEGVRCTLSINHDYDFGRRFQDSTFRFEGENGVAVAKMGILVNYPHGEPDELWIAQRGRDWTEVKLEGGWFPHAFVGIMSNLQRFAAGEDAALVTSVQDAWHTMALIEACFTSSAAPATPVPSEPSI